MVSSSIHRNESIVHLTPYSIVFPTKSFVCLVIISPFLNSSKSSAYVLLDLSPVSPLNESESVKATEFLIRISGLLEGCEYLTDIMLQHGHSSFFVDATKNDEFLVIILKVLVISMGHRWVFATHMNYMQEPSFRV